MEAAFKKFRTVIAIAATIVMGAAMIQTIAPAADKPVQDASPVPADVLSRRRGRGTRRAPDTTLGNEVREAKPAVRTQEQRALAIE